MKIFSGVLFSLILLLPKENKQDNTIRINQIQVIGSHNSYKKAIDPALFKVFQLRDSVSASKIDYEHIPLADQLNMGLLNLEIDVYTDEKGGKYAHPKGLEMVKDQAPYDPEGVMEKPGFKVLHIPDLDFRSQGLTLADCLNQLKVWSEAHPNHHPIFITLEAKDEAIKLPGFTVPEKFTAQTFDELDESLVKNLGKQNILTPDEVRGKFSTLNEAVTHNGWPTLQQAKGKFLFVLDAKNSKRAMYIAGHPSLKGRVLFADADPGTSEAAMMIRNNPQDPSIKDLVKKGYIIRTRSDGDTQQARKNDKSDFIAACNSGAQIITTDYYLKSTHFKSDYVVSFPGDKYFRVNPLFSNKTSSVSGSKSK